MSGLLTNNSVWIPFIFGFFLAILVFLEIGRVWGRSRIKADPQGARAGVGGVEGAIFALLGLLMAFTFGGAAGRFDDRRQLIVDEANAVETAYARGDLMTSQDREAFRPLFRDYVTARIETFRKIPDEAASDAAHGRAMALQADIWKRAVAACEASGKNACAMLLLPALNEMSDAATKRDMARYMHPPVTVFAMLFTLAVVCAFMVGFAMAESKRRNLVYAFLFATTLTMAVSVILDMEHPRLGFIRVDSYDRALVDLRDQM